MESLMRTLLAALETDSPAEFCERASVEILQAAEAQAGSLPDNYPCGVDETGKPSANDEFGYDWDELQAAGAAFGDSQICDTLMEPGATSLPEFEQRGALARAHAGDQSFLVTVFGVRDSDGTVRASGAGPLDPTETASLSEWPEKCWK